MFQYGPESKLTNLFFYSIACNGGKAINDCKPIKSHHRSLAERVAAANRFVKDCDFQGEVVCDSMANDMIHRFDAHPERLLIIEKGVVVHKGGKGPLIYYDIKDVIEYMRKRDNRSPSDIPSMTVEEEEGECST